jgi:hypothetical protein
MSDEGEAGVSEPAIRHTPEELADMARAAETLRVRQQIRAGFPADAKVIYWSDYTLPGETRLHAMLAGDLAHSGAHGPCPHSIKICITQVDNSRAIYKQLAAAAGAKPAKAPKRLKG